MIENDSDPTPQFSTNSLRDVVLESAVKILDRDGLNLAADSISYARVFAHIEETHGVRVTRGSVHERIWASHDDFRRDVLAELVSSSVPADYFLVGTGGLNLIEEIAGTDDDPGATRSRIGKLVSQWMLDQLLESEVYCQVQSAKAMATRHNDPKAAPEIQRILEDRAQHRLVERRAVFQFVMEGIGLRLKPSLGLSMEGASDLFFQICWALLTGTLLNAGAGCTAVLDELESDLGGPGDDPPWTIFSLGATGIVDLLFEADPAAEISSKFRDLTAMRSGSEAASVTSTDPNEPTIPILEKSGRRTRGELKQLVLRGGVETLQREGMNLRPESLSYAAVFAQVYADQGLVVNRASVHKRFWPSHLEFCLEVMGLALAADPKQDPVLLSDVYAVPPAMRIDGSPSVSQTALDTLQAISRATLRPMLDSPVMRRRTLIKTAIPDQPESPGKAALKRIVVETELAAVAEGVKLLKDTVIDLGFEVRPELELDDNSALEALAILIHVVSVGASFEQLACGADEGVSFKLERVEGSGELDEWSVVSVLSRAVFEMLYQPKAI